MQTHLVTILKKMAAVDSVEKPAAVLLNQSIVQANRNSNTSAFVLRLCVNENCPRGGEPCHTGRRRLGIHRDNPDPVLR
jgi:hypothetical protein